MKKQKQKDKGSCTISSVGGQALLEGVMMKSPKYMAMAVRRPDGTIDKTSKAYTPWTKRNKFFGLPIVRGCVSFVESLSEGMRTMTYAAEIAGEETEEPTKFEKWLSEKMGKAVEDIVIGVAMVLGVALAVGLFFLLPTFLGKLIAGNASNLAVNLVEGLLRVAILIGYMAAISLMKELRRVYMYHGAEHKTIACYEAGEPLTVENVRTKTRFHARCGTNYLFLVMMVSILFYALVGFNGHWAVKAAVKIACLPIVAGLAYEVLKAAAKGDGIVQRVVRWPGLMLQRLTTREPDDGMIECAITAFELALDPEAYWSAHPDDPQNPNRKETGGEEAPHEEGAEAAGQKFPKQESPNGGCAAEQEDASRACPGAVGA